MSFFKRLSRLIWGEEEEPLLNETQITLIRNSWQKVEAGDFQETGLALFRRLFQIAPYLKDLFPFGHKPENEGLSAHALGVMQTVDLAVKNLDNPIVLKGKLLELGKVHKPFELTDKEYTNVAAALLWTLEVGLGEAFTEDTKQAWVAAYGFIQKTMKEGAMQ